MPAAAAPSVKNLAEILLREGLINEDQFEKGMHEHEVSERPLSRIFIEMGAITEGIKIGVLQKRCDFRVVSLKDMTPRGDAMSIVNRHMCEKYNLVPLKVEGGSITVAMEDPMDARAIKAIEALTSQSVIPVIAKSSEISDAIQKLPHIDEALAPGTRGPLFNVMSKITLPLVCFIPILSFYYLIIVNDPVRKFWQELNFNAFDRTLVFVLGWSAWAIVAYWIDGILFGKSNQQEA